MTPVYLTCAYVFTPLLPLMPLIVLVGVLCRSLVSFVMCSSGKASTPRVAITGTITKAFEFHTRHEFVKQFHEWLTIELDDHDLDINEEMSNFLTMEVVDSRSDDTGHFTIVLVLRREWFTGPYTSRDTSWASILTEADGLTDSEPVVEEVPFNFLVKTDCLNPKTRKIYSPHVDDQAKRDKVFFCFAENLRDYVFKVRRGVISYAAHTSLWLTVLSKGRRWFNHNKDVPFLHFKFVDKDGIRPPLFEHTCPVGEAITKTYTSPVCAPLHAPSLVRSQTYTCKSPVCAPLHAPSLVRSQTTS